MGITLGENSCSRALCAIKLKPDSSWVHFLTQNIVPASVASASPGNLVELQILRSHPRYTESEALGGAQKSVFFFTSSPGDLVHSEVWEVMPYLILFASLSFLWDTHLLNQTALEALSWALFLGASNLRHKSFIILLAVSNFILLLRLPGPQQPEWRYRVGLLCSAGARQWWYQRLIPDSKEPAFQRKEASRWGIL